MSFQGQRVLIAGATSGIGAACARELGRRGATVVAVGRRAPRLEELGAQLRALGAPEPLLLPADLTDEAQVADLMRTIEGKLEGLDLLLYCAGIGQWLPLLQTSLQQVRQILEVNLVAAIGCIQGAVPLLRRRGGGRIVLVSSVAGLQGMPGGAAYSASKAALEGLADALRIELAADRIAVQNVYPSMTRTEFFDNLAAGTAPSMEGKWSASPDEVALAILKAVQRGRRRSILSLKGRLIIALGKLAPGLLESMQRRKWKP